MSDKALSLAIEGKIEKDRESWEQTRIIAYYAIAPHLGTNKSMTSVLPFEWDKKVKAATKETIEELINKVGAK